MNRTALRVTWYRQAVHKFNIFPEFPMLSAIRQNSYVPRSRRCIGRREAQSREPVNKRKDLPV
jgi:hypothetical protein